MARKKTSQGIDAANTQQEHDSDDDKKDERNSETPEADGRKFDIIPVDRFTNPVSNLIEKALDKTKRQSSILAITPLFQNKAGSNRELFREYQEAGGEKDDELEEVLTKLLKQEANFLFDDEEA